MKILVIAPQPFMVPRGTPIAVRAAVEVLAEQGHEVDLLTLFQGEEISIPGVTIHRIPRPPLIREVPIGPSIRKAVCDLSMLRSARRIQLQGRHDILHGVEDGALIAWALSRRTGVPYVYDMDSLMSTQISDLNALFTPAARIFAGFEAAALRQALGVLAVCPALAEIAAEHQDPENIFLLPDMPLNEGEDAEPSAEVVGIGGTRIVYVGNFEPYQGVDLLIRAFRKVAPRHPDAQLVLVGGSDSSIAEYRKTFADLLPSGRLHFLGPRPLEQLGAILAASDILVSPRLQGVNTPMKIYSYLESGRPVVATRLLTHTQVVSDETACLVPPTSDGIAEGLDRLLADPEGRRSLGNRGKELVRRDYGRARFAERLEDFYSHIERRLAHGGPPRPGPGPGGPRSATAA